MVGASSNHRFVARSSYRRTHALLVNIPRFFTCRGRIRSPATSTGLTATNSHVDRPLWVSPLIVETSPMRRLGFPRAPGEGYCRIHGVQPLVSKAPSDRLIVTEARPAVALLAMMLSNSPLSSFSRAQ